MSEHNNHSIKLEKRKDENMVVAEERTMQFSGPLPHPDILEKYEQLLPGVADRIVRMAESQSEHRKLIEVKVIYSDTMRATLGICFAFTIVITSILVGTYLIMHDKTTGGLLIPTGALVTIVGAFIYQKRGIKKTE